MPREIPFSRLLPVALALTLIGLTAFWGGWLAIGSGSTGQWPFAFSAALWPLLAWVGCCGRRRAVRARSTQSAPPLTQADPPPGQPRNSVTPTLTTAITALPEAERESTGERSPEFAGAFKR